MQQPHGRAETPQYSEDWKSHYFQLQKKYPDSYISPPARLAKSLSAEDRGPDIFGTQVRYEKIREFLQAHQPLDRMVDIGGNCGYFALSLLDEGLVKEAVVYDVNSDVLEFGERMAAELGLDGRCRFVNQPISLSTLDDLPDGDVIVCQYLIHHAGKVFDKNLVKSLGWEEYAQRFLRRLQEKFALGIIGNAYKTSKPAHWKVAQCQRPSRFQALLKMAGWKVQFQKCLHEMITGRKSYVDLSVQERHPVRHFLLTAAWQAGGPWAERKVRSLMFPRPIDKMERYYLYLTEGGRAKAHADD